MLGRVVDWQAQPARALIEVEGPRLEDRGILAVVEVLEVDEVRAQERQIPVVADQPLDVLDPGGLGLDGLVGLHELGQGRLQPRPLQLADPRGP